MFGRRNPDRTPEQQPAAPKPTFSLDMLDDLPDFGQAEQPKPAAPAAEPAKPAAELPKPVTEGDPAWFTATPALLGPSVTQLLRQASGEPAPAPDQAKTQQLPAVDLELAQPISPPLWEAQVGAPPQLGSIVDVAPERELAPAPLPTLSGELGFDPEEFWSEQVPLPEASLSPAPAPVVAHAPAPVVAPPAPVVAPPAARSSIESVIGPDDFFDGHYRSERGVRIQGNARGSIESRQYILVEAGAQVEADLAAQEITIAGNFTGQITCQGRLEISASGVVQGVITTSALVVHEGGLLDGELHMRRDS